MASRKWVWLGVAGSVLLLAFGCHRAWSVLFDASAYDAEVARLRELGAPVNIAELQAMAEARDPHRNAAPALIEVIERTDPARNPSTAAIMAVEQNEYRRPLTEKDVGKIDDCLAKLAPDLAPLDRALAKPELTWLPDWREADYQGLNRITKLLKERADAEARHGHPLAALIDVRRIITLSQLCSTDPSGSAANRAITGQKLALTQLARIVGAYASDPSVVRAADDLVARLPLPDFRTSLLGQPAMEQARLDELIHYEPVSPADDTYVPPELQLLGKMSGSRKALMARLIHPYRRALEALPSHPTCLHDVYVPIERVAAEQVPEDVPTRVLGAFVRDFTGFAEQLRALDEQIEVSRLALRLCHRRLAGLLPSTLANASSSPVDGKPFHYRKSADAFVVYGVGPDKKDDGGQPSWDQRRTGTDVVWRIPDESIMRRITNRQYQSLPPGVR